MHTCIVISSTLTITVFIREWVEFLELLLWRILRELFREFVSILGIILMVWRIVAATNIKSWIHFVPHDQRYVMSMHTITHACNVHRIP